MLKISVLLLMHHRNGTFFLIVFMERKTIYCNTLFVMTMNGAETGLSELLCRLSQTLC
jgi:hypothetical protein